MESGKVAQKKRTARRNKKLKEQFEHLYNKKRLRLDDAIQKLCEDFFLAESTVQRIIFYT